MPEDLLLLIGTAALIGALHTLLGPDHYLPFVAMARAGDWSWRRTCSITVACGVGHVTSSMLLGWIGIGAAAGVDRLVRFESARADLAAWGLIAFGLIYGAWGLRRAVRGQRHTHWHVHHDGTRHDHTHEHQREHLHPHASARRATVLPWALFVVFLFGPCEPLVPLLMYPALAHGAGAVVAVALVFGIVTIATMLVLVRLVSRGVSLLGLRPGQRYGHALAGGTVLACGFAIKFLGW